MLTCILLRHRLTVTLSRAYCWGKGSLSHFHVSVCFKYKSIIHALHTNTFRLHIIPQSRCWAPPCTQTHAHTCRLHVSKQGSLALWLWGTKYHISNAQLDYARGPWPDKHIYLCYRMHTDVSRADSCASTLQQSAHCTRQAVFFKYNLLAGSVFGLANLISRLQKHFP